MTGIYMFEHKETHKKYVGQSINITKRKWEHLTYPSPFSKFDDILRQEGLEKFDFIILEECSPEQLDERENYWINHYDSITHGYNLIKGGNCYRGENNIQAKLADAQVKEIITLLEQCKLNNREIAEQFHVSRNTIDLINRCITWTHLHSYVNNIRQECLKGAKSTNNGELGTNKITEEQAKQIIILLQNDPRSLAQLSRDLNVSLNIIYDINRCRTWRFLHNYKNNIRNEARKVVM